jgi:hypothetical protein
VKLRCGFLTLKALLILFFGTWFIIQAAENSLTTSDYNTLYLDMSVLIMLLLVLGLFMTQNKRLRKASLVCTRLFLQNIVVKDENYQNIGEGFDLE